MSIESLPYPTREISTNLPLFLSDIGAVAVPIPVTGTQTIIAIKGSTYITYGSGTITFTDPDILTAVSGDHYKVIVGGTSVAIIGGVTYNKVSPIEILRLVSSGSWITHSGLDTSQITSGIIDAARLPSYVDDVLEFANIAAFPTTGEVSKIYVALNTNKTYRWSGSVYIEISPSLVVSVNGYADIVTLTKSDIGLGNVDNTSDLNKPISTATQSALNLKVNSITPILPISGPTTFTSADDAKIFHVSGTTTLTLPAASNVSDGWSIGIVNVGVAPITVNRVSTNTINGTLTTFSNTVPYSAFYIYKSSSSTFVAIGILY
jgi:hypothetical protein